MWKSKKKKQLEDEMAKQAFLSDYREVVKKHGIDFGLYLDVTKNGIRPVAQPIKVQISEQPKTDIK